MGGIVDFSKSLDLSKLKDKSVLVTGGASGIGAGVVAKFAENGAHVTIADINENNGRAYAEELTSKGHSVTFAHTDVVSWTSQVAAFKSALAHSPKKRLDIVVVAAGLLGSPFIPPTNEAPSLNKDPQEPLIVDRVMDVNFLGVYFTCRLAEHYFSLQSSPPAGSSDLVSLIVFGSLASYTDFPPVPDYLMTKAAVRGLFRSIRSMMAAKGCRMNLIAPDIMDTPMAKDFISMFLSHGFAVGDPKSAVDAVTRCAVDDQISGRSIGVGVEESFDLRDDAEGQNGWIAIQKCLNNGGQKVIDTLAPG